jgi:hypothetical protein
MILGGNSAELLNAEISPDVNGETHHNNTSASVCQDGTIDNWHHDGTSVRWQIKLDPGVWQCSCITRQSCHGMEWVGGRKVEVSAGSNILHSTLTADVSCGESYYASKESILGTMIFNDSFTGSIAIRTLALGNANNTDMHLEKVILRRIK